MQLYAFDMDGTLSDDRNRTYLLEQNREMHWNTYHAAGIYDPPFAPMLQLLKTVKLEQNNWNVVEIWTARPEKWRSQTKAWLTRHGVFDYKLRMRKDDDFSRSSVVKTEWLLDVAPKFDTIMVFDDSTRNIEAMRWLELPNVMACQVNHRDN